MNPMQPKTKLEIIDFVVSHFTNNPRSMGADGYCKYNGPNGEHCAFALMCENPKELPEGFIRFGMARIKPEFDGYSEDFYHDVQSLHDNSGNWKATPEGNELTPLGVKVVEILKEKYK